MASPSSSFLPVDSVNLSGKRVLVVPLRFVGDAVVTLPLLETLKRQNPSAHLSVWCSAIGEQIFGASAAVDCCVKEPKTLKERWERLREGRYDVVIILRKSVTMSLLCQWAGIPVRCGYDMQRFPSPVGFKRTGWGLTHVVNYPDDKTNRHQSWHHLQHYLALVGSVVSDSSKPRNVSLPVLNISKEDEDAVKRLIKELTKASTVEQNKPYVVLHGLSASASKNMPLTVFNAVVRALAEHEQGFLVCATGTEQDKARLDDWIQGEQLPVLNVAGKTSLLQLTALLRGAAGLVGLDSGPVHLAGLMKTPVIALYGQTNPVQWGPLGEDTEGSDLDSLVLASDFLPVSYSPDESEALVGQRLLEAVQGYGLFSFCSHK